MSLCKNTESLTWFGVLYWIFLIVVFLVSVTNTHIKRVEINDPQEYMLWRDNNGAQIEYKGKKYYTSLLSAKQIKDPKIVLEFKENYFVVAELTNSQLEEPKLILEPRDSEDYREIKSTQDKEIQKMIQKLEEKTGKKVEFIEDDDLEIINNNENITFKK